VHEQLAAAAALGDDRTREIAAGLATAATPAVRLALLNALSGAADEITAALLDFPGSPGVAVHLDGDEVAIDIRATDAAAEANEPRRDDGDSSARISLRLSETLKAEIDAAAEREGVSVNTWLMRAASAAVRFGPGPAPGFPFGGPPGAGGPARGRRDNQHRITGWING
jgi:hypothetical protein